MVKVSYARASETRAWRAHARYLSRKGAQRPAERGRGFDAERDDVSLPDRFGTWEKAGDPRLWKIIVSPEAGDRVDLRAHTRALVEQIEADLGTRLEWAAIEHRDTEHPHVHIGVRGVDENGRSFRIEPDYIRSGIRARSQELLTQTLGYRHEHERRAARERAIAAPRWTEIDRGLLARASPGGEISLESPVPRSSAAQERRLQDLRRLQFLERFALSERTGERSWRLSPDLERGLRQIQLAGDVQKSLAGSGAGPTDRHASLVLTRIEAGLELTGRVHGPRRGPVRDEPFLILEGTDGRRHLVPRTDAIARAREAGRLRGGQVVTARGRAIDSAEGRVIHAEIATHGVLRDLKRADLAATPLDRDALRSIRETGTLPAPVPERSGFFRQWRDAVIDRGPLLERLGLIQARSPEAGFELTRGAERAVQAGIREREQSPVSLAELQRAYGKPVRVLAPDPVGSYRGELVAYARGEDGAAYAVLDTGRQLSAFATQSHDLEIGAEAEARARPREQDRERRPLTWALDDLERRRERDRGRGR